MTRSFLLLVAVGVILCSLSRITHGYSTLRVFTAHPRTVEQKSAKEFLNLAAADGPSPPAWPPVRKTYGTPASSINIPVATPRAPVVAPPTFRQTASTTAATSPGKAAPVPSSGRQTPPAQGGAGGRPTAFNAAPAATRRFEGISSTQPTAASPNRGSGTNGVAPARAGVSASSPPTPPIGAPAAAASTIVPISSPSPAGRFDGVAPPAASRSTQMNAPAAAAAVPQRISGFEGVAPPRAGGIRNPSK